MQILEACSYAVYYENIFLWVYWLSSHIDLEQSDILEG